MCPCLCGILWIVTTTMAPLRASIVKINRDKLVNLQSSTGYRFDGNGYAIVSSRPYRLRPRSSIQLRFKTFEKNGLLFLAGKGRSFLSIELNNGNVVYQYNLGQGALLLKTTDTYSNGQWHTVDAVRQGKQGVLKVGTEDKFQGEVPGTNINLQVSDNLYFGGYPGNHNYRAVSNEDFNGCIDGVEIDGQPVDLSQNVQAFGVIPGCPVQMASLVAFEEQTPGYLHWPNASANNFFQVNFKFKTSANTGLLFYAANRDQSSTVSLSLIEGGLALRSGGEELTSGPSTLYNDDEWHVITATHDASALHLDIDDFETFHCKGECKQILTTALLNSSRTDTNPPMLQILYGKLYFGGVPSSYEIMGGATATSAPFIGCLGDATVNGMFINFANATDRVGTILGKCSSSELPRPEAPTIPEDDGLPITPEEGSTPVVLPLPASTQSTPVITDKSKEVEPTTERTTYSPTTPTIPTPAPTPTGECVLPVPPATDLQVDGVRFGTIFNSRHEYHNITAQKFKHRYSLSLDFKTVSEEGVLFYAAGSKHRDFVTLFLKEGQVHYSFNCGSGPMRLMSPGKYNDGQWHTVVFFRNHTLGKLTIDNLLVAEGTSKGSTKTLDLLTPFFLGSVKPQFSDSAKINMMANFSYNFSLDLKMIFLLGDQGINGTFEGCVRNFLMSGKPLGDPDVSYGVVPCSDKVEQGVYFSEKDSRFTVGLNIIISMDIKPRNISGILLSVHGKRDYLILQMVNGVIKFTVDNGKGAISASFKPPHEYYFCDGKWHNIQALKTKNVVTLSVDKISVEPRIGIPGSSSTETRNPLFIGGHPRRLDRRSPRGLETKQQYTGCITNVYINDKSELLPSIQAVGNVTSSVCPTI
uniref:Laminin G domain-containing protein n=1 Tax=Timema tahoe TaxID=61484 RepID=A0A7R9IAL7_9NEOP|nr:unnamed protein product [Timema tahoe]